ncbi:uncharacterized protein BDR25DRAFT_117232 [Lindgomyces ingoldianus]|uniref:Uncharacterized protein n=1 Tax=Lindgomyces ingoldianus TaxID=673940 RepID=A0ACB6Q8W5_9PLEO|nr:uncharacterized protein BDR25DRAFT_117232 [Lindgomyces ingoldianus]KAF2463028.1 hypothetical protein BDR25DRAFT_117232 [Lindgomyces ingoldianus]
MLRSYPQISHLVVDVAFLAFISTNAINHRHRTPAAPAKAPTNPIFTPPVGIIPPVLESALIPVVIAAAPLLVAPADVVPRWLLVSVEAPEDFTVEADFEAALSDPDAYTEDENVGLKVLSVKPGIDIDPGIETEIETETEERLTSEANELAIEAAEDRTEDAMGAALETRFWDEDPPSTEKGSPHVEEVWAVEKPRRPRTVVLQRMRECIFVSVV